MIPKEIKLGGYKYKLKKKGKSQDICWNYNL